MNTSQEKKQFWISSGSGAILVIAILIMINVISHFAHVRLDLSQGRIYSITPASLRIVRALPDPVLLEVFYSRELPPQILATKGYLQDFLKEYASRSQGKLRLRFVEVGDDLASRQEAVNNGISQVLFDIVSREKYEQRKGFLGLTIRYQDKKDSIGFVQGIQNLEYDLTSRIKTISAKAKPVLGFVSSYRSLTLSRLDPGIQETLGARYELRDVDLSSKEGIPLGMSALFFLGPQGKVSSHDLAVLDNYLRSGRSLCLAIDRKRILPGAYLASDLDTGMNAFLGSNGLTIPSTLVLDPQSMPIQVFQQQGSFTFANVVQYPPVLLVKDLDKSHPVTQGLDSLVLPFASPVWVSSQTAAAILARSSNQSWAVPPGRGAQRLYPFQIDPRKPDDWKGPFPLAVMIQQGQERLAVIGTSKFAGTPEFKSPEPNQVFFMNLADWLSQDIDLIAIRSKAVTFRPLKEVSAVSKKLIRYTDLFLPPGMAILIGLLRLDFRRKRRREARREFGSPPAGKTG